MGWTSYHAKYYKPNGEVDRKAEMDHLYTWEDNVHKVSVVKSRMVGSTYYAAIKVEGDGDTKIIGAVALTCGKDRRDPYFNFGYKGMEETSGPYAYDCPKSILDLLTPTDNEHALEWRRKCSENLAKKKITIPRTATRIEGVIKVGTNASRVGDEVVYEKGWSHWSFINYEGERWQTSLPMIRATTDIKKVVIEKENDYDSV